MTARSSRSSSSSCHTPLDRLVEWWFPADPWSLLPPLRPIIDSTSIQILTVLIDSYKQVHKPLGDRESSRLIQYIVLDTIIMKSFAIASLLAIMASITVQALPAGAPADPDYGVSRLAI
jgi:hypothetical protein